MAAGVETHNVSRYKTIRDRRVLSPNGTSILHPVLTRIRSHCRREGKWKDWTQPEAVEDGKQIVLWTL